MVDLRPSHRLRQGARWMVVLAVAAQVVAGLVVTLPQAGREALNAWHLRHETFAAARRRALGEAYVRGLEAAEAAIPRGGSYVLLDLDGTGTQQLLQGDLAPRRALAVRSMDGFHRRWHPREMVAGIPPVTVVFRGLERPPEVVASATLLRGALPQ